MPSYSTLNIPNVKKTPVKPPKSLRWVPSFVSRRGLRLTCERFGESNRDVFFHHHHHCSSRRDVYDLGFSFFSFHRADSPTPETLTTLKRTPGISPLALPLRPNPARRTSSFSSTKFRQPSLGTKAVTFFPFLMSWTRTHFRIAELGCLASTPTFSRTIPLACEVPPVGEVL